MRNEVLSSSRDALLRWVFAPFVLTLGFELWLCGPLIRDYFPTNDELALEMMSTRLGGPVHPSRWVTQGFHNMLACYPEWLTVHTDVWRPLANALLWLHYEIAGTNWGSQLVFGYLVHATLVAIIAYLAHSVFELRRPYAALAIALAAFNPGLWSPFPSPRLISNMLEFPIHQTEMTCALLMLLAFLAFLRERYALFALLSTLAVSLKETGLTAPLSALAALLIWRRTSPAQTAQRAAWVVSPLLIWLLFKLVFFEHGFNSTALVSHQRFGWIVQPIRNLLFWPSGLYIAPLAATKRAILGHDFGTILVHLGGVGLNAVWWLLVAWSISAAIRASRGGGPPRPSVIALTFALGNLALVVMLQDSQLRYGYFWFMLGPAVLFAALPESRTMLMGAIALSIGLLVPQVVSIERAFSPDSLRHYAMVKSAARQLTVLLGDLPTTVERAYVIDDTFVAPASPGFLESMAGFHGKVVLVNGIEQVHECSVPPSRQPRYRLRHDNGQYTLEYLAPPGCYKAELPGLLVDQAQRDGLVQRGPWLRYSFPARQVGASETAAASITSHWTLTVSDPACERSGACAFLGLDAGTSRYSPVALDD